MSITYFDSASNPADNGSANEPVTLAITPPSNMVTGDLIIIGGFFRNNTTNVISQSELGGQSWTVILDDTASGSNGMQVAAWFCEFDGTWDANPSIAFSTLAGTVPTTAFMHVFRGATSWSIDTAAAKAALAAATTVSLTAQNPTANDALEIGAFLVADDTTWGSITGSGWALAGAAQYRNTAGSDMSAMFAYNVVTDGAQPAALGATQSLATAGITLIVTFTGTVTPAGAGQGALLSDRRSKLVGGGLVLT